MTLRVTGSLNNTSLTHFLLRPGSRRCTGRFSSLGWCSSFLHICSNRFEGFLFVRLSLNSVQFTSSSRFTLGPVPWNTPKTDDYGNKIILHAGSHILRVNKVHVHFRVPGRVQEVLDWYCHVPPILVKCCLGGHMIILVLKKIWITPGAPSPTN